MYGEIRHKTMRTPGKTKIFHLLLSRINCSQAWGNIKEGKVKWTVNNATNYLCFITKVSYSLTHKRWFGFIGSKLVVYMLFNQ